MRAIGYFRADAPTQADGRAKSLEDFESDFLDYCDLNVHQPVETFGDERVSDRGRYVGYDEMLSYIRESGYDFLVAVPDAGHLGTDLESVARTFLEVEGTGCKVSCQDEDLPDPLQNALRVLGVSGISKTRSGKIRESMQERALWGKALGRPPFGYRNGEDGKLAVVKDEAAVVELIFRLYTKDDKGMRLIVQHLNERGIATRQGGRWSVVSVRDILKNPVYIGTYTRFGLRLPGAHEAIIERSTFRAARDIASERRPRVGPARAEPYLLSGIVFCDYCGNRMMGVTRRQMWSNRDGIRNRKTYRYYQCQSRNNQSVCGYHTWREADLEGVVLAQLPLAVKARRLDMLDTDRSDAPVAPDSDNPLKVIWRERVVNAERRLVQAMRKTAAGGAKTDLLARAVRELDVARDGSERAETPTDVEETLSGWEGMSFTQRRDFLLTTIAKVEVSDHMARVVV